MSGKGIDCNTVINSTVAADLVRSGYAFVCRYINRMSSAEAHIISDAGLNILTVYETTADRPRGGTSTGNADGAAAYKQAQALEMPTTGIIYFTADFEAKPTDMNNIESYLRAARTQTGPYEVGIYGDYSVVEEMFKRNACKGFWQTYAWSNGQAPVHATVYQYKNDQMAAGISVDFDEAYSDVGMWSYRINQVENLPKGTTMNIVQGSTVDETKMIDGIQKSIGAVVDGEIGTQTMSDIACRLKADCFPLTLSIYGMPVIIANDLVTASPHAGVGGFDYSMTGGFNNGGGPCSICVIDGQVICGTACHSAYGCPETVLYKIKDGPFGIKRVKSVDELPANLWWAVGGLGLGSTYNPDLEGFKNFGPGQDFSDVIRDTDHCMVGIKNNHTYQVYCASMTGARVNAFAATLGLEMAVMGDGGSWAAMNGSETFAQKNLDHPQLFMVQGVK